MMKPFFAALALVALAGCGGGSGGKGGNGWDMDPRLDALAEWSYACARDAAGLDPDGLPVPPVKGVDEPWGPLKNKVGSYTKVARFIQVQITRQYDHLVNIMLHEMGHAVEEEKSGSTTTETYANWINQQCLEIVRPDIYPAPAIGSVPVMAPAPSPTVTPKQGDNKK